MEIFGRNIRLFGRKAQTRERDGQQGGSSVSGGSFSERIVVARDPMVALTVSPVYRATKLLADTMSVMPVQYQKKDLNGNNYVTDMRGLGKRLNYLLQEEPNPIMTATDLWKMVDVNRTLFGNGFVYIERDEFGFPAHLWLVRMGSYDLISGLYNVSYLGENDYIVKVNVPREDVMHFPNTFKMQNGFWGISTLQFAAETLSLNKTLKAQSLETAAKGGRVKGFISESQPQNGNFGIGGGMFGKTPADNYAKELQQKLYSGQDILAIRGLDKFTPISMTSAEMQAAESLGLTYDDCARFWGVPRPLLMLDTNSHYNDYQNATMEFHTRTILPQKVLNEKEIARKLIPRPGGDPLKSYGIYRIHICEKPLLAMDPERQAKVDMLNLQTGAKTVNEVRAEHDMPAVEDGDVPMASANLMTLKALIAKSDASTQLKPGTYTVGGGGDGGSEEG